MKKTTKILFWGIMGALLLISGYTNIRQASRENISSSIVTLPADTSASSPKVNLTANNKSFLQVLPGQEIRYSWDASNAQKLTLSFETLIAGPKASCSVGNQVFQNNETFWVFTPQSTQSPCTWKVTLTAENTTTSKTTKSSVYIKVNTFLLPDKKFTADPTASLTVNGLKDIEVPTDLRNMFRFKSTNADYWLGTYEILEGDSVRCKLGSIMFRSGDNGSDGTYGTRFTGCKWQFNYVVANSQTGVVAQSSVTLKVK